MTQSGGGEGWGMVLGAERQKSRPETKEVSQNTEGSADHVLSPSRLCGEIGPREKG